MIDLFVPESRREISYWLTQLGLLITAWLSLYPGHERAIQLVAFGYRYTADLRRTYSIRGECNDVIIPLNDIDLLAAQFSNDRLNASSLHADACAHRIDILLT